MSSRSRALLVLVVFAITVGCGASDDAAPAHAPTAGGEPAPASEPSPAPPPPVDPGQGDVVHHDFPAQGPVDAEAAVGCAASAECTLVPGVCGGWVPTNVTWRDRVAEQQRRLAMAASCEAPRAPLPVTSVSCADGRCTLERPELEAWRACTEASECVAVEAVCGGWDAAARGSEAAMRAHYTELSTRVRCAPNAEPAPSPVCRDGWCVAR